MPCSEQFWHGVLSREPNNGMRCVSSSISTETIITLCITFFLSEYNRLLYLHSGAIKCVGRNLQIPIQQFSLSKQGEWTTYIKMLHIWILLKLRAAGVAQTYAYIYIKLNNVSFMQCWEGSISIVIVGYRLIVTLLICNEQYNYFNYFIKLMQLILYIISRTATTCWHIQLLKYADMLEIRHCLHSSPITHSSLSRRYLKLRANIMVLCMLYETEMAAPHHCVFGAFGDSTENRPCVFPKCSDRKGLQLNYDNGELTY